MDDNGDRGAALLDRIVAVNREVAAAEASRAALMAEFVAYCESEPAVDGPGRRKAQVLAGQFAADEIAAEIHWSTARVQGEVADVGLLMRSLPSVWALWAAGEVDGYRVSQVTDAAHRLVDAVSLRTLDHDAAEVITAKTATQVRSWCTRFVARTEPEQAERRHARARADRRVETRVEPDGMGSLWALLSAVDAAAVDAELTRHARRDDADDPRTMDQRRADALVDAVLGRTTDVGRGRDAAVVITVPVQSLLGLTDSPAELGDRSGTVPASLARQIAARPGTLFHRALTDPAGHVLDVTELGRFPSQRLGFAVDLRDGTCTWTTCTARASACDANHDPPWPEGQTRASDLSDACRWHHNAHTHGGFGVRQRGDGVVEWTTPRGRTHTHRPDPVAALDRWPAEPVSPCTCDVCDEPRPSAEELQAGLRPDEELTDLTPEEIGQMLYAA